MSAVVAIYIRRAAAAAWLMQVPVGGMLVAVGHCWVALRVWLNCFFESCPDRPAQQEQVCFGSKLGAVEYSFEYRLVVVSFMLVSA